MRVSSSFSGYRFEEGYAFSMPSSTSTTFDHISTLEVREEIFEVAKRGLAKVFQLDFDEVESRKPSDRDIVELAEIISIMKEPEGEA